MSSCCSASALLSGVRRRSAQFSFGAWRRIVSLELSRDLNSIPGLRRPDDCGSLPGQVELPVGPALLERFVVGEDVPGGDEDLACDRCLGRVGLAAAMSDVEVELMPGVLGPPAVLGGLDGGPRSVVEPALDRPVVLELCPDWRVPGARPEYPTSLRAVEKRETSPISAANVSPSNGPIPGIVSSSTTRGSLRASGASSRSSASSRPLSHCKSP